MIIGTCSLCGGPVETPDAWMGTLPAPATCKHCGAVRPQHGPVIDMQRPCRPGCHAASGVTWRDMSEAIRLYGYFDMATGKSYPGAYELEARGES